jgi:hypothetical protein
VQQQEGRVADLLLPVLLLLLLLAALSLPLPVQ